jgi:hypothetical protein
VPKQCLSCVSTCRGLGRKKEDIAAHDVSTFGYYCSVRAFQTAAMSRLPKCYPGNDTAGHSASVYVGINEAITTRARNGEEERQS